jgi:hypothetical protein
MLTLTGYSNHIYGRPGDTIEFKVNCERPGEYSAEIVRIICGDTCPEGPGVKEIVIDSRRTDAIRGDRSPSTRARSWRCTAATRSTT